MKLSNLNPRAVVCFILLGLFSLGIIILQQVARLVLCANSLELRRRAQTYIESLWVDSLGCLFKEVTVITSGDELPTDRPIILIMNHQIDADWWFMWVLSRAYSMHGHVKIILKASLSRLPLFGQGMEAFEFIFLQRNWAEDRENLVRRLAGFLDHGFNFWLFLFPEGTTIHTEAVQKGHDHARKEGRPLFKNVLLPRTTGFQAVLNSVGHAAAEVYDVTMVFTGFSGEVPDYSDGYGRKKDKLIPNIMGMLRGIPPTPVYLHLQKHTSQEIQTAGVQKWLDERWAEKDQILQHFAATGSLPEKCGPTRRVIKDHGSLPVLIFLSVVGVLGLVVPVVLTCVLILWLEHFWPVFVW